MGMVMCFSANNLKMLEYSSSNGLTMNHARQLSEQNTVAFNEATKTSVESLPAVVLHFSERNE